MHLVPNNGESPPSLFRPEVGNAKRENWLGSVILLRPVSFRYVTIFAIASAAVLVLFFTFAQYTKRTRVTGLLVPDTGLIKVQSPQSGIVSDRFVSEGQQVNVGDPLFSITSDVIIAGEKNGEKRIDSGAEIVDTLHARQESLREERSQQASIAGKQSAQALQSISSLEAELQQVEQELATQETRLKSADAQYRRFQQLSQQGYVSPLALQQKQDEFLEQQGRLQTIMRNRLGLVRDLNNAKSEFATIPVKSQRELTQLERQTLELQQQAVNTEAHRKFLITAPQSGTVTAILADPGQVVGNQTMLTILPSNAKLEAHLYVPSRAVGFIEPGQKVLVRFAAFPYQKFGQYEGAVHDVSRVALPQTEMPSQVAAETGSDGAYRVRVTLDRQDVTAYGKRQQLSAGMQLDGDILQDRRSLVEWILEPLYSLKGKI